MKNDHTFIKTRKKFLYNPGITPAGAHLLASKIPGTGFYMMHGKWKEPCYAEILMRKIKNNIYGERRYATNRI